MKWKKEHKMASMNAMPMHQMHPALAYGHHPHLQVEIDRQINKYIDRHFFKKKNIAKTGKLHYFMKFARIQENNVYWHNLEIDGKCGFLDLLLLP